MAAIYALGLDNLLIEVDGAEMPIMDGSSAPFIEAIEQAGIVALAVKRRYIRILKPVRIESGASWSEFTPYDGMRFEVEIDFDCPLIGRQAWKGDLTPSVFKTELSRPAPSASCAMSSACGLLAAVSARRSRIRSSFPTTTR